MNGSEGDVGKNQGKRPGTTAESEKLVSMTQEFMSSEKAGEILDSVIGEKIAAKIEELIPALEDHLEMLEILSMLFPGRMWDHSLQALHREYFGNLEKYAAMLRKIQTFIKFWNRLEESNLNTAQKAESIAI